MQDFRGHRGFTLIELGAVMVVGGSIAAVMAPVGGAVQEANLDTKSQWVHHGLARRQLMYIADHKGMFTGPNSSGAQWNREPLGSFGNPGIETLAFDTAGGNPTTMGDWITPLVGDALGFSANRAVRMQQMLEMVADPTVDRMVDGLFDNGSTADREQFAAVLKDGGYRQRSFLQVRSFSQFSNEHQRFNLVTDFANDFFYREHFSVQSPQATALSPEGYTPHIWNVGTQLSNKVMFADGTRFYTDSRGLEFDIRLFQEGFEDDSTSGPIFDSSAAYGRGFFAAPNGENLELSFRKQGGKGMYVTMFDGSLQFLTKEEAWTDPTPWYPSGSTWTGNGATVESQAWIKKNLPSGVIP